MNQPGLSRSIEIILAVTGLIAAFPLLIIAACLIALTTSRSIFFCQKRIGLNGRLFTMYKFRTMRIVHGGSLITAASDQRVTPFGRILRKTKIDELPELWNVVRGDMSFVGPRPEVPHFFDSNNSLWQKVITVKPGITDPMTLRMRNEEFFLAQVENKEEYYRTVLQPFKLRGYIAYLEKRTWSSDLIVIWQTISAIIVPHFIQRRSAESVNKMSAGNYDQMLPARIDG